MSRSKHSRWKWSHFDKEDTFTRRHTVRVWKRIVASIIRCTDNFDDIVIPRDPRTCGWETY